LLAGRGHLDGVGVMEVVESLIMPLGPDAIFPCIVVNLAIHLIVAHHGLRRLAEKGFLLMNGTADGRRPLNCRKTTAPLQISATRIDEDA
jgi:hypothetical protein